ncbi:cbb3-type cytochrome oxidase assembly protein CcoS [beta proteobacterium MWH-UniP1]
MEVLPFLIVISLAVLGLAVWLFFRMSDSGQFDDVEGPARRILLDDDRPKSGRDSPESRPEKTD